MTEFDPSSLTRHAPGYPYRLLTVAPHGFICSERTMAEHAPLPVVTLSQEEAVSLGLRSGDTVSVESPTGKVRAMLQTRAGQRSDILVSERGGWLKAGHGLNRLTRDITSRIGNGAPYYETCVRVLKE